MPKFPKRLYIARENVGTDEQYLAADTDVEAFADVFGKRHIGVYVLKETVVVTTGVKMERVK